MEKIFYTKEGIDSEVLTEAIQLRTSLRTVLIGLAISDKRNLDGSIIDDNIEIQFTRALISAEHDEITGLINMVGPMYDLMIRKNIEKNVMSWARKTGNTLLDQLGANNIYRGKTDEQVDALSTAYPDIYHTLGSGSLQAAYRVFCALTPDVNITQEEVDEFKLRLEIILGM